MNDTIKTIMERRSARSFFAEPLDQSDIMHIVLAGQYAPSARGRQPWHMSIITNKELLDWMSQKCKDAILREGRKEAVLQAERAEYHVFHHAPAIIVVSGDESNPFFEGDCAMAVENMALAAYSLGIASCIIASFRVMFATEEGKEFIQRMGIPEGYMPLYALALGKSAENPEPAPRKEGMVNFIK